MKAKFKVNDNFRLTKDHMFERAFPLSGYKKDGSVGKTDQQPRSAGSAARITEVRETSVDWDEPWYDLELGELKLHLQESKLLKLFEPV